VGNLLTRWANIGFSRSLPIMQYIISTNVKVRVCTVLWVRDGVSHVAVRRYLISFTCISFSPLMVAFLAVKVSPMLDEPCVTDSSSTCSGSSFGTLYFGSPAELAYVSALIQTEILSSDLWTCHQTGCHILIHSPSVDTNHFVTITEADRVPLKRKIINICLTVAWIL
jgi:hypothetical protein